MRPADGREEQRVRLRRDNVVQSWIDLHAVLPSTLNSQPSTSPAVARQRCGEGVGRKTLHNCFLMRSEKLEAMVHESKDRQTVL